MPKQFDIFVDEYQSAEGTNQEFDIYIDKTVGKNLFNEENFLRGSVKKDDEGWYYATSAIWTNNFGGTESKGYGLWRRTGLNLPQVTVSFDAKTSTAGGTNGRLSVYFSYMDGTNNYYRVYDTDTKYEVQHKKFTSKADKRVSFIYFSYNTGSTVYLKNFQVEIGNSETTFEPYVGRQKSFDICVCNQVGADINMGDITIYSLPFRTTTRVNNELILSVPNDAVRNYVEQRAKVDSSFLLGADIDTRVEQVTKVASDMVISVLEKGSIEVNSGMVIDVSIGGTTLWRYRLLSDMDDSKLSVYDNMTLGDTDIVVL